MEHVYLPFVLYLIVVIAAPIVYPIYLQRVKGVEKKIALKNADLFGFAYIPRIALFVAQNVHR